MVHPHVVFNENFDAKVENKNPPTYFFNIRNRHFRNSGFEIFPQKEAPKIYQYEVHWKTKKNRYINKKCRRISVYKLTAQQLDDERTTADGQSHNS